MQLSAQTIRLGATPRNKREAIEMAGITLVDAGLIEREYIQSMMQRELQANTFLGRGIAIPHGMAPDRHLIKRTGIGIVQIPQGVEWNEGERVDLVVAIAAKSDEHLQILAALTDVLDDESLIEQLAQTTDVNDILAALNGSAVSAESSVKALEGHSEGVSIQATIVGHAGLHARPATRLMEIASQFESQIYLEYGGKRASAKAVLSLLKLGVAQGETVRLSAQGVDADQALVALKAAIESGLGDASEETSSSLSSQLPLFEPTTESPFLSGVKASLGLVIAPLHFLPENTPRVFDRGEGFEAERAKLERALLRSLDELQCLAFLVKSQGGRDEAAIFMAQLAFLEDADLRAEAEILLKAGHSASWAWHTVIQARVEELSTHSNSLLAQRSADLQDIGTRVLLNLDKNAGKTAELPTHPVILVARDLLPSQVMAIDTQRVVGVCTVGGGPTSHTAILARSLGLPLGAGFGEELLRLPLDGATCILDANAGRLYTQPTEADLVAAHELQARLRQLQDAVFDARYRPALLRDGSRVEVVANIGTPDETAKALEQGAEGVGLLRSEFLFLGRETAPTEEEQFAALCEIIGALNGLPLVVRTLDIGGDKVLSYLPLPHEDNPFLGVRGARLTLRHPELFATQLRAIFRASEVGPLRVLFPMIGSLEEWRATRDFAEQVRLEVGALPVQYGVMVEVPTVALLAREFAEEVDFFSIGTNDLTQYTLAIDRLHPELGADADALHPAVLRLIAMTVEAAQATGKPVSVCGGMSDEPFGALLLTGLGVKTLSMSLTGVPQVKAALRRSDRSSLKALAEQALKCRTTAQVRALGGGL